MLKKLKVENMRAQWDGVAILAIMSAFACALFAMGKTDAAGVVLTLIVGQALPSAVKMHEGGE